MLNVPTIKITIDINERRVHGPLFRLRHGWFEERGGWLKDWLWVKYWQRQERKGGDTCGASEPNGISLVRDGICYAPCTFGECFCAAHWNGWRSV